MLGVGQFHAVLALFCGSLCGKMLIGINMPLCNIIGADSGFSCFEFRLFLSFGEFLIFFLLAVGFTLQIVLMKPVLAFLFFFGFSPISLVSVPLLQTPDEQIAQQN